MTAQEADAYVQALSQPGKVLDTRVLMSEFSLKGSEVARLTQMARERLIQDPGYMSGGLTEDLRLALSGARVAEQVIRRTLQAAPRFRADPVRLYSYLLREVSQRELTRWTPFDFEGVRLEVINPDPRQGFRNSLRIRVPNSSEELIWSSASSSWRKTKRPLVEEALPEPEREESDWERDFYKKPPGEQIEFLEGLPKGVLQAVTLVESKLKPAVLHFLDKHGYRF
jgi:hypothetical protein